MNLRDQAHLLHRLIGHSDRLNETERLAFIDMRKRVGRLQPLTDKQLAWAEGVLRRVTAKKK